LSDEGEVEFVVPYCIPQNWGGGVMLQTPYPWIYDKLSNIICHYDCAMLAALINV